MSGPKRGTGLASFKQETTHPIGSAGMGEVVPGEELYGRAQNTRLMAE